MIKRSKKVSNYVQVSNKLLSNKNMSFESKGLLCFVLSLPEEWVIHKNHLVKHFNIGRKKLNKCFTEIEKEGYLISADHVRKSGKFDGKAYIFYDEPQISTDVSLGMSVEGHPSRDIPKDTTIKTLNSKTITNNTKPQKNELQVNSENDDEWSSTKELSSEDVGKYINNNQ